MTSYRFARRSFLQAVGGAACGLSRLLTTLEASAAGAPAPVRFLVIHHPLGAVHDRWRPGGTPDNFTLSPILQPFAPLRDSMVVLDGMDVVFSVSGGHTHEGGMVALMTGQPTLGKIPSNQEDHAAGGASIDQLLLADPSSTLKTPLGSLQLAADTRSDFNSVSPRVMSYLPPLKGESDINKARQPLYPELQPLNAYKRLFANMMPGGDAAALARARARKKSVLDFVTGDLTRLGQIAPVSEKPKLDAHAEAIRKLEVTFDNAMTSTGCMGPATPMMYADFTNEIGDNPFHGDVGKLHLSLIKTAFACDLLRVATFMWSPGTNHVVFGNLFPGMATGEHHPPSHTTDAKELDTLVAIDTWYSQQTSAALQDFRSLTDVDGKSLLDNTVVAYVTEIGRAYDHDFTNNPMAVFGGGGGRIKGNRFFDFSTSHRPTNDLWLALAPVFGVTLPKLGAQEQYKGPVPGLVT
jgi:hypothetical protein